MVFSRNDVKRRNKYVHDPLGENPKRIKVHAQRKFAQGSGMNSPVMTPVKEKEKAKPNGAPSPPELLPIKRPTTEDFLNFLCFRGTSVLPPRLDFFSESSFAENTESSVSSASKQSATTSSGVQKIKTKSSSNQEMKKKLLDRRHANTKGPEHSSDMKLNQSNGNAMRARTASDERQSRKNTIELQRIAVQRRSKPIRKTHPAILKRLGAARLRAGLRSAGQLPPGSEIGIKSDRKPRRGRPPRRRRLKAVKKEEPAEDTVKVKEEPEDSDEEVEVRPSIMSSMRLRTRGSSSSPAQPPKTLNVSSRPSRKTKEAATLYMEMLTKDLRSPDEEFDEDYIKNLPELPSIVKKEQEDESKEVPSKKTRQQVKEERIKVSKSLKETTKMKIKEEVDSDIDEENEPLLTRTQKLVERDNSRNSGASNKKECGKKLDLKKTEDSPKVVKRLAGKRELRTLKERKNMNDDDHVSSDSEEEEFNKVSTKKIKEEKAESKVSVEAVTKTGTPKRNDQKKAQGIVKKNVNETKKGRKFQAAKVSNESFDESTSLKTDNDEESRENYSDKLKTVDRRKLRKHYENEDRSPKGVTEPKIKPEKRTSSLNKEEKFKVAKLSKDVAAKVSVETEKDSDSELDEENEPLLKRSQRMQKKEGSSEQKKISSGRSLRSSDPKVDSNHKSSPRKRGRKSLKEMKGLNDERNEESVDDESPVKPNRKKVSEEKNEVKDIINKKEIQKINSENSKSNVKETTPKRGRRISLKNSNLNNERDSKVESSNEDVITDKKSIIEKGLDITNRVNITQIRSKKVSDDVMEMSSPSKVKSVENKVTRRDFGDTKELDTVPKSKVADSKMKKVVQDEKLVDVINKVKIDQKTLSKEKVTDEDISINNKSKLAESKISKIEDKGVEVINKVKLADPKTTKRTDENKGMDITNKVKIPDCKVSKKTDNEEKDRVIKKSGDSKRYKSFEGSDDNRDDIEFESAKEIDMRRKKKTIETNDVGDEKIKLKRVTRQSSGGPSESDELTAYQIEDAKLPELEMHAPPKEGQEKTHNRRSSFGSKIQSNKKDHELKSENAQGEKVKVASIGKRKSVGDRDSCDTVHSGSSGIMDCKVVLESLGDVSKEVPVPSKKLKANAEVIFVETAQSTEESPSKDRNSSIISSSTDVSGGSHSNTETVKVEDKKELKEETQKPKQSIGDTWRQAFKNAKIPKPGQLSPVPHTVKPFVRHKLTSNLVNPPFSSKQSDLSDPKTIDSNKTQKLTPNLSPFKAMLASQNQRSVSPDVKRNASPGHKINYGGRDSPLKRMDEVKPELKKQETPVKTFTQLQYEKRSSEFINSLLDPGPSILPGFESIKPFKREIKIEESKEPKQGDTSDNLSTSSEPLPKPAPEGKHLNLPLAVEHALRKMSPVTVSRKPVTVKPVIASSDRKNDNPLMNKQMIAPVEKKIENPSDVSASPSASISCSVPSRDLMVREPSDISLMSKKKVNMTAEEITRWLNDNTSSGIEHKKDCGIFENKQCECGCGFRTCKEGSESIIGISELVPKDEGKIDHGVVEPPVQLKELAQAHKYEAETISTCKVEDYKEKLLTKSCSPESKMAPPKPRKSSVSEKSKNSKSMTEEEMYDFDFRFERTSISPRESMSDLSSITPRDDASSSSEVPERKIFQQRRLGTKRPSLSKSPSAFSAENESSIYAFKPDPPQSKPFRRGREKSGDTDDGQPSSSSIAVQVNIESETEAVLECSTQTDREADENEGHLFYIPLPVNQVERGLPQGVAVKLDTEGPDQRVIMRAKLVTKPSNNYSLPSSSRALVTSGRNSSQQKPEQKVRPLWSGRAPVGTVQPTLREQRTSDQGTTTTQEKGQPMQTSQSNQTTQSSPKGPDSPRIKNLSKPQKVDEFPPNGTPPTLVEAPTFYPTEKEFQDPLEYIEQLTPLAQSFGICRIVPPSSFKPECKVTDEMRFTAYNQYVHKMMERWGPNVREMSAIRKYLRTQSISLVQVPSIGSMEVDLPRLYQTVQQCGGLMEVMEKKRWARVADVMRIPKSAQDRVTKLDDIYCKYLLPYDTLSHGERSKLLEEVDEEWKEHQKRLASEEEPGSGDSSDESEDNDWDECIAKGRKMPLSAFYRTARNTMAMWFKDGSPTAAEVEAEYWKHVSQKTCHVCVHSGSIDSGSCGYGFPTTKTSATSRHPWNLKVLTNSPGSILRSLGPVMGITVPTLHVGMLFSSCCWYRDPHSLPWIEYLHTGASKIWYGVPDSWCSELRQAMYPLLPRHTRDRKIWLPSDTMMVPPTYLLEGGASLCRVVQEPGQFILVFPKAFTSSISTGYVVSESVYFAQPSWLNTAEQVFKEIKDSSEPPVFSLHKLLFNIANDPRSSAEILIQVLPMVKAVVEKEVELRKKVEKIGLVAWERIPSSKSGRRNKKQEEEPSDLECDTCRGALFLSMVSNSNDDCSYCIEHAIEVLSKDQSLIKCCKLKFAYDEEEMEELVDKIKSKIETKTQKKQAKEKGNSSGTKN